MLTAFDDWVLRRTDSTLDFLLDWFSISQKFVERVLIGLFALSGIYDIAATASEGRAFPTWAIIILYFGMGLVMLSDHNASTSERAVCRTIRRGSRLGWLMVVILAALPPYRLSDLGYVLSRLAVYAFLYVYVSNCNGKRGRKRKMAWSKLKELFTWLPEPQPEGA